jgi:hypothetical protein
MRKRECREGFPYSQFIVGTRSHSSFFYLQSEVVVPRDILPIRDTAESFTKQQTPQAADGNFGKIFFKNVAATCESSNIQKK